MYFRNSRVSYWEILAGRREAISSPRPDQLIGSRAGDPADLRTCTTRAYIALAPGLSIYDWDSPERVVPSPPLIRNGPFTEIRAAPNPTAAVFGLTQRRRVGSPDQSIWQALRDAQKAAIYRVEAPGVRIKNCSSDGRFAGGLLELRHKGELARRALDFAAAGTERWELFVTAMEGDVRRGSKAGAASEWPTLEAHFDVRVAAVELPDDSNLRSIRADWSLIGSCPRLEALVSSGSLRLTYVGQSQVRILDLLRMRDARSHKVGWRVACFLAREASRDLVSLLGKADLDWFSIRRKSGFKDWLKFATAVLGALSGLGSVSWLLAQLFGWLK
jgi:hypothetical protein